MLYIGIAGGVVVVILLMVMLIYNKLIRSRNLVQTAWSDIDVNLQKRFSLVPQLVALTKGYAEHEAVLLEKVVQMRTHGSDRASIALEDEQVTKTLHRFTMNVENYPQLKADGPFLELMEQLSKLEDHLEYARKFYNGATRVYNTDIQSFPASMIAGMFGFKKADFYEINAPERAVPNTELS